MTDVSTQRSKKRLNWAWLGVSVFAVVSLAAPRLLEPWSSSSGSAASLLEIVQGVCLVGLFISLSVIVWEFVKRP